MRPFHGITLEYNKENNHDHGLIVTGATMRKRPEEQVEVIEIEGRNGSLVDRLGTYHSYERSFILSNFRKEEMNRVHTWLSGRGILRTSEDKGGFFYADVLEVMERKLIGREHNNLEVLFLVDPFFYLDQGEQVLNIDKITRLHNMGTIPSRPYLKVYGSGNGQLIIAGQVVNLSNIDEYIEIDSKLMICHKDRLPTGRQMEGDFPVLPTGYFVISFSGGITRVELTPRWCEL